jgi:hypothetical protein
MYWCVFSLLLHLSKHLSRQGYKDTSFLPDVEGISSLWTGRREGHADEALHRNVLTLCRVVVRLSHRCRPPPCLLDP